MPHLTIEYSANVAATVDIDELVEVVHEAAKTTGIAPLPGLRTRAIVRDHYLIADGHPDNSFLAIWARLSPRSDGDKTRFVETIAEAVVRFLGDRASRMAISVEMHDINEDFRVNVNNVRNHMEEGVS